MFKLLYLAWTARKGFVPREENFTDGEHRTVVEIAREKAAQPDKYKDVKVLDLRLVKAEVVSILPVEVNEETGKLTRLAPVEVGRKSLKVPALAFLDLGKLPRKKAPAKPKTAKTVKVLGVPVAGIESLDVTKPKRVSKRARQYGVETIKS